MKLKISFPDERVKSPILSEIIIKTGVLVSIVSSHIDSTGGEIIIEVIDKYYEVIKNEFEARGVTVTLLDTLICRDESECVDCGACISVCPSKVFSFADDWSLAMDMQKCVKCGLCIDMCPHQALSIEGANCE
ncbi:Ion-translocating oxidoreductase complex subunit B [Methanimicrococcus hongohii]|uniref:Ion-translocating oxidoreductase complex subunit B n=1 Tax=Methanimicrococcus hongohii TaxID=3028295 RepID=A0AA96UZI8_9EURY|nr:4Fe-4S dicluster domain-containing protein [Methanimicrococcus sp. Hf6]WNY23215.1 Ion-translocating oxidoreductase complex subunit B [Methanimicrococcus sp. Hf6]